MKLQQYDRSVSDQLTFERPTTAEYRAIRYWMARNIRKESPAEAGQSADFETEQWLADQASASAADHLVESA